MNIDAAFLRRCLDTLEHALAGLEGLDRSGIAYDIYRAAAVKQFELALEQACKLMKLRLRPWFTSNREADRLAFKDVFRHAARRGIIDAGACERWFAWRDNRNVTAHDYGEGFAAVTLKLLPAFVADARALADIVEAANDG